MRHTWQRWFGISVMVAAAGCGGDGGTGGGGGSGPGESCTSDESCVAGHFCAGGVCVQECRGIEIRCPAGMMCDARGRCVGEGTGDAGPGGDTDAGPICTSDADCDDGVYCNGEERCGGGGACAAGEPPDCDDGVACTTDSCSEETRTCTHGSSDADGDGFVAVGCGDGDDCDDTNDAIHPGADETCDTVDDDCDPATLGEVDADGDTYVSAACCNGAGNCGTDCADDSSDVHPDVTEVCNRIDDNCDGATDEGVTVPLYLDVDSDSYGSGEPMMLCADTMGFVPVGGDCDDGDDHRHPGAAEMCNGIDEDCDMAVDDGAMTLYTIDADGDGYGSSAPGAMTTTACMRPAGYAETADDCNDGVRSTHPGAREFCDAAMVDDDCDGTPNELCPCVTGTTRSCCGTRGTETCEMIDTGSMWGACSVSPTTERCNAIDDDCDGTIDDGASATCGITGQTCSAGSCVCPAGQSVCGTRCVTLGAMCDGSDGDSCATGRMVCSGSSVVCDDDAASTHTDVQCGMDRDCDGNAYENITCDPRSGATTPCDTCTGVSSTYTMFARGTAPCAGTCTWSSTCSRQAASGGINQPPGVSPWVVYTAFGNCGGSIVGGRDYQNPYVFATNDCPIANINNVELAPGRYDVTVDHYDSAVLVTPRIRVQIGPDSRVISNTIGGWQPHSYSFTVTSCQNANIAITSLYTYYDGSSGGSAGYYRGGDTIGNIRISGPY